MQRIDITVTDKTLDTTSDYHLTSGGINDAFIKFHFEPGYSWENYNLLAMFNMADGYACRITITPDTYYAIPAAVLAKAGTVNVGVIGHDDNTVITSLTIPLTVERNIMDIIDDNNIDDLDLLNKEKQVHCLERAIADINNTAQSLAKLNMAYTKAEADDIFVKKTEIKTTVDGTFDATGLTAGTSPVISFAAVAPQGTVGSVAKPATLKCIEKATVHIVSDTVDKTLAFDGFVLRRLSDDYADRIVIEDDLTYKEEYVYELKLSVHYGSWITPTTYRVSLLNAPAIDTTALSTIICNAGDCILEANDTYIDLVLPSTTTTEQLNTIVLWIPKAKHNHVLVSKTGLGTMPTGLQEIGVQYILDETITDATFTVIAEIDFVKYVGTMANKVITNTKGLAALADKVDNFTTPSQRGKVISTLDIDSTVLTETNGVCSVQINVMEGIPLQVFRVSDIGNIACDFYYVSNDTGFKLSIPGNASNLILVYAEN